MPPIEKGWRRRFTKYNRQFIEENNQHAAQRRRNDDTQDDALPRSMYHAHTSIDVTHRDHHSVKTSYFRAPQAMPVPHVTLPVMPSEGISEAFNFDVMDEAYVDYLVDTNTDMEPVKSKRKRTAGDDPQKLWIPKQDKFLREFIRLEGCGDPMSYQACQGLPGCLNEPVVRCRDCEGSQLYCQACIVVQHTTMPLHHMEIWSGSYFQRILLRDLGHRVQLGHPPSVQCCNPALVFDDDFVVLEINGIHRLSLNFCNCATAQTHNIQLLHACWYPSTTTNPQTAAAFRLLDHFQMYTFESKGSAFKYYQSLARLTDNTGTCQPKDRYESFLRMSPGCGHDSNGVLGTKEGELAVLCPACPHPGKNLPPDWGNTAPHIKWLYGLFLAIDANFRLCRRNKSSKQADPSFNKGWAYFMEQSRFKEVLEASGTQVQEKSSCASHNAVNLADTKNARRMAATGVGAIVCARHNLTRPSAVGDLQKGEKYVNMDYVFFSTLQHASTVRVLNISYDIACQWSKHLWSQMSRYPSTIHLWPDDNVVTFVVLKFHLPAHILSCQTKYSLNLIKGMARTDGEAVERGWSNINPIATSTQGMGPGSRRDILDDHFGDWNWCKVCNLGPFLLRKLKEAIPERNQHILDLRDFEEAIPPTSLDQWR
ncbi:uncharacterized protein HD556DRAFT_1447197 [Suillus plorans]|uniref:CxC2-like cysteine cluster KDZ transposase-associated domain-containing protein n=1 Tax=Suillus plorans TaxID=116603 RepID=A0A9P7AIM4_9AGAM|nr:uncharacterized protein HD556DRAFT_1447197 [Suillus plorans]KAG1789133.1 hypothetical protein HD556DRAFT_1447197 [Suillus plorans]